MNANESKYQVTYYFIAFLVAKHEYVHIYTPAYSC